MKTERNQQAEKTRSNSIALTRLRLRQFHHDVQAPCRKMSGDIIGERFYRSPKFGAFFKTRNGIVELGSERALVIF
jgi:hypothetical protein